MQWHNSINHIQTKKIFFSSSRSTCLCLPHRHMETRGKTNSAPQKCEQLSAWCNTVSCFPHIHTQNKNNPTNPHWTKRYWNMIWMEHTDTNQFQRNSLIYYSLKYDMRVLESGFSTSTSPSTFILLFFPEFQGCKWWHTDKAVDAGSECVSALLEVVVEVWKWAKNPA